MTVFDVSLVDRAKLDDRHIVTYLREKAGVVKGDDDFEELYAELLEDEVRREFGFVTTGADLTFALRPLPENPRDAATGPVIHVTAYMPPTL